MNNEEKNNQAGEAEEISPQTGAENEAIASAAEASAANAQARSGGKKPCNGAKKRKPMSKQLLAVIISLSLVLLILATVLITNLVRSNTPPKLEEVRDEFANLIDASFAVNEIIFGKGLPTYPRVKEDVKPFKVTYEEKEYTRYYFLISDAEYGTVVAYNYYVQIVETREDGEKSYAYYDILTKVPVAPLKEGTYRFALRSRTAREDLTLLTEKGGFYYYALPDYKDPEFLYEDADDDYYDYVRADSPYKSVQDIKDKVSAIYSNAYLQTLYESLFTGVAFSEDEGGVLYARYRDYVDPEDDNHYLQQSNVITGYELPDRRYDYDTMEIARGSNARYVKIKLESYIVGDEQNRITVTLAFALEGGEWYLDSPSY